MLKLEKPYSPYNLSCNCNDSASDDTAYGYP